jgi:predicted DNA-binding transcriptional regulator YafY
MAERYDRGAIVRRLAMVLLYTAKRRYAPSIKCMARGLGVCERTIRRDLEALEEAGWPMPRWRDEQEAA